MREGFLREYFESTALPRARAVLTLIFAAAAFLAFAGWLEYATGSPDTHGQGAAGYWALFFAFYAVACGGAGLLGAFPSLARWPVKLGWLAALSIVLLLAHARVPAGWTPSWRPYGPAALVVLIGLWWRPLAAPPADSSR